MSDGDELTGSLAEAASAQMRNAVLGDDVVNVVLRGGADCAGGKDGLNFAYRAALCGRGEGDEALAAPGLACAAHEVDLAAGAGHVLGADRFRADLTEEVDLDGRVDGDHVVVLADDVGVVDVVDGQYLHCGVIVDKIVDPLRAVSKGGDGLVAVYLLLGVIDRAALKELDHGIGEHFGMYAEVVLGLERHAGSIGDSADAELDARAVGYLLRDEVADGLADLVDDDGRQNGQLVVILDDSVDLRNVKLSAAQASRLIFVYLDEDPLCLVDHRLGIGAVEGEAEVAVAVHGRYLDAECVVLVLGADVARDIAVVGRQKIRPAAVYRLAGIAGAEPGEACHLAEHLGIGVKLKWVSVKKGLHLQSLKVAALYSCADGVHNSRRLRGRGVHSEDPAGLDLLCKLLCTYKFFGV